MKQKMKGKKEIGNKQGFANRYQCCGEVLQSKQALLRRFKMSKTYAQAICHLGFKNFVWEVPHITLAISYQAFQLSSRKG